MLNSPSFYKKFIAVIIASMLVFSCSDLSEKLKSMTDDDFEGIQEEEITTDEQFASETEKMLAEHEGQSVITGIIQQEGTTPTGKFTKFTNAANISKLSKNQAVPLTDADV